MKKLSRLLCASLLLVSLGIAGCAKGSGKDQPGGDTPSGDRTLDVDKGLAITGTAKKLEYKAGQSFNPDGLSVSASFTDATTMDVTALVDWLPTILTKGLTSVTASFSFGGKTATGTYSGITVTSDEPEPEEPDLPVGSDVTIYLSLSSIGLYEGQKGQDYEEMNLENAIKLDTKVGDPLPGADKVTSTSGAEFKGWMAYDGEGAPTSYTTAPGKNNKILLANFSGGSGGGGGDDPVIGGNYLIGNFSDWKADSKYALKQNPAKATEYMIENVSLTEGDTMKLVVGSKYYGAEALKTGVTVATGDGTADNNIKINSTGAFDFYFDTQTGSEFGIWVQAHTEPVDEQDKTFYLDPGCWDTANAWYAIFAFGGGLGDTWIKMSKSGTYYQADVDVANYTSIIFCRMNPASQEMSWSNKWNQTNDLKVDDGNLYTISDWGSEKSPGTWSTIN